MTPDFVLELRKLIGHGQLWLSGVAGYVEDGEGRILLAKREDNGLWSMVAGIIEPFEQPADAIAREVKEEAGVECRPLFAAKIESGSEPRIYPNGDKVASLSILFYCKAASGQAPTCSDGENTEAAWFNPLSLPSPMSGKTRDILRYMRKKKTDFTDFMYGGSLVSREC